MSLSVCGPNYWDGLMARQAKMRGVGAKQSNEDATLLRFTFRYLAKRLNLVLLAYEPHQTVVDREFDYYCFLGGLSRSG